MIIKPIEKPQFQAWNHPDLECCDVRVQVLRLDAVDEQLSGNKFYKLVDNLIAAKAGGFRTILSFGGMWSNHLHALSAAGERYGFNTIGVVRGHEGQITPMLNDARKHGMTIHFVGPSAYQQKESQSFILQLRNLYGDFYSIPEGGSNIFGVQGCARIGEIIEESNFSDASLIALAVGTGATAAGLCCGLSSDKTVLGVCVLKGAQSIDADIRHYIDEQEKNDGACLNIDHHYHFGGYAKLDYQLAQFVDGFNRHNNYQIEPVYTGKAFYAVWDKIRSGDIAKGSKVVLLHTGGMQGAKGTQQSMQRLLASKIS